MARVLIVDDDASMLDTFTSVLQRDGHETQAVASAEEALKVLKGTRLDVVVSDILLGGMDGIGLLRRLRALCPKTKVILVTGYPSVTTATEAVSERAFAYLHKPVERAVLASTVREAARVAELEAENQRYRAELELLVEERTRRLRHMLRDTVETLSHAMEIRDPYTAGHQQRVAELAVAIGEAIGYDDRRLEGLRLAAMLHDIGKLHIPAEILSKPALLTPEERDLIRDHSQHGAELLSRIDFEWPVADIVRQHHERLDGSGYPDGIQGDELLPEALILGVADVVEAMVSHRPYRSALAWSKACEELHAGRDRLYEAGVVDACCALLEAGFEFETKR